MGHQDCGWRQARCRGRASGTPGVSLGESGTQKRSSIRSTCSHTNPSFGDTQAQEKAKPDASAIYVPGNQTAQAIEEAIEAEIPLVVAVAEHVPIHDILRVSMFPAFDYNDQF